MKQGLADGVTESKKRIAIIMLNSPNIPHYAHFATLNNYLYATQHGYDFIVERQPGDVQRDWTWDGKNEYLLVWYKAEFIKRHLANYHYVLFVDSDAIFSDFSYRIENILVPHTDGERCMIFQEDVWFKAQKGKNAGKICTGLIFVQNCQSAFRVLDTWAYSPYVHETCIAKYRHAHPREQGCIQELYDESEQVRNAICIFPARQGLFGQYDSDWIIHLGGVNKTDRTEMITRYFKVKLDSFIQQTSVSLYGSKV